MAERLEGLAVANPPDQAESLWRPFRRRARRTRRPARVDMRCRKPCRFARRRLLGWNVRFTSRCLLDHRASRGWRRCGNPSDETPPAPGSPPGWAYGRPIARHATRLVGGAREARTATTTAATSRRVAAIWHEKTHSEQDLFAPERCPVRDRPQGATVAEQTGRRPSPLKSAERLCWAGHPSEGSQPTFSTVVDSVVDVIVSGRRSGWWTERTSCGQPVRRSSVSRSPKPSG
jgi:hypothetical protein